MAGTEVIMGANALFKVGTKVVACASDFKLTIKPTKLSTVCQGSGEINTGKPGNKDITWSCSGLAKFFTSEEETDNISPTDWIDAIMNNTSLTIVFEGQATGDRIYTLVGFLDNYDESGKVFEISTYTASGWANSFVKSLKAGS